MTTAKPIVPCELASSRISELDLDTPPLPAQADLGVTLQSLSEVQIPTELKADAEEINADRGGSGWNLEVECGGSSPRPDGITEMRAESDQVCTFTGMLTPGVQGDGWDLSGLS